MNKCNICNEELEDKYFDTEQNKCILHCEKKQDNGWCTFDTDNEKIWNLDKINLFWEFIQNDLNKKYNTYIIDTNLIAKEYILSNVIFPKFQDEVKYFSIADNEDEMGTNFYSYDTFKHPNGQSMREVNTLFTKLIVSFDSCTFLKDADFQKYDFEHELLFNKCKFESEIQLNKIHKNRVSFLGCTIGNLNCENIVFEQKIKIQNCTIRGKANFCNTKFKELADFYRTKFNEVIFKRADFENVAVFSEAEFNKDVDFKYVKFLGYSVFRDTVIKGKLDLRNTIFDSDSDANFLDITSEHGEVKVIQVANRETARLIKSFYEYSNNIIEANKFYALEMQEREKELTKDIKNAKNIFEWLIFKAHAISSNHSQNWVLTLLWILNIGFIYSMYISTFHHNNMLAYISIAMVAITLKFNNPLFKVLSINLIIFYCFSYIKLDEIADKINPFSIMTSKDPMPFGLLLFKITIAYLIYQFIVSVRQNTRRK